MTILEENFGVHEDHVMIDVETLGTSERACILSIGAIKFDINERWFTQPGMPTNLFKLKDQRKCFYAGIDLEHADLNKYEVSGSTLKWWAKQKEYPRNCAFLEGKLSHFDLAQSFYSWFQGSIHPWSQGATFDLPKVEHLVATEISGVRPWPFWSQRDTRTMGDYLPETMDSGDPRVLFRDDREHHPLWDCYRQICCVQEAHYLIKIGAAEPGL